MRLSHLTGGVLALFLAAPAIAQTAPGAPAVQPPAQVTSPAPPETPAPAAPSAQPEPAPGASTTVPAPPTSSDEATGHIPPPAPNKGEVVFFRIGAYAGAGVWFKIRDNGQELGKLTNASWFAVPVDPGKHTFTAATENQTKLTLEIDPGETYYVRGTVHMGLLVGEPSLSPADASMFELHYKHMHPHGDPPATSPAAKPES